MYQKLALLLITLFFFQCENAKVKVDEQAEELPIAASKDLAVKTGEKTFRLERKSTPKQSAKLAKQPNMTGYFVYAADAAIFYPCGTTERYPVTGDAYLQMEKEYMRFEDLKFAEKVYAELIADFNMGEGMESGREKYIVVDEFLGFERGKNCE